MILGISASGRKDGITSKAVKKVLEESGLEYEYISLAGKRINGCIGCNGCASDNVCKLKDDWNEIGEKMLKADAIVFGAPNYYGAINGLGHACLERTFSFRHREAFNLQGKLGVIVSTGSGEQVHTYINRLMTSNRMIVVGGMSSQGYAQCYTCGHGHDCRVGAIVPQYGILEKLEEQHYPPCFEERTQDNMDAKRVGEILANALRK